MRTQCADSLAVVLPQDEQLAEIDCEAVPVRGLDFYHALIVHSKRPKPSAGPGLLSPKYVAESRQERPCISFRCLREHDLQSAVQTPVRVVRASDRACFP